MKRERVVPIIIASAIIVVVAAAGVTFAVNPAAWQQVLMGLRRGQPITGDISASGFIEAEEISIAPEVGGRIVEVFVAEGDQVETGQVLVQLDGTLAQAQAEVAQTGLEVAEASLAQVRAGARPERIRQAEALVAQAEAWRDGAYHAWQDALALVENPQELNAQIVLAEAQLTQADAGLRQAGFLRDIAQDAKNAFDAMPHQWQRLSANILTFYWKAWVGVNTAGAAYDGAQQRLSLLYAIRSDPQELQTQADAAEAQYKAAEAAVEVARAQLEGLQAGATEEEVAAAEAQVQQAQAQLDSALVLMQKLTLTSPAGGQVLETVGHVGELAVPGATVITLADLDQVALTVYVPENRLGLVRLGQRVEVRVDSFPDRVFWGEVTTIASKAEFTPRNVQTQEERENMVFAVTVVIPNPDHSLKPGIPADAVILTR